MACIWCSLGFFLLEIGKTMEFMGSNFSQSILEFIKSSSVINSIGMFLEICAISFLAFCVRSFAIIIMPLLNFISPTPLCNLLKYVLRSFKSIFDAS